MVSNRRQGVQRFCCGANLPCFVRGVAGGQPTRALKFVGEGPGQWQTICLPASGMPVDCW